jgi:hypothetical protein
MRFKVVEKSNTVFFIKWFQKKPFETFIFHFASYITNLTEMRKIIQVEWVLIVLRFQYNTSNLVVGVGLIKDYIFISLTKEFLMKIIERRVCISCYNMIIYTVKSRFNEDDREKSLYFLLYYDNLYSKISILNFINH